MKRRYFYVLLVSLFVLAGCQHELQWNLPSEGTLLKQADGNCFPANVAGSFIQNKVINDSDFLIVNAKITRQGPYTITSDSVNGYCFKSTGTFNTTGTIAVKLPAKGKPISAGTDHFTIQFNNSICEVSITVLADTVVASNYTLQGSPGVCISDSVAGDYIQGIALDTSNKIIVAVNVITPGSYSVTCPTVNGYSFSASGIFTSTGLQNITLSGSGVPVVPGNDIFAISAGSSTCSFSVKVAPVATAVSQYYFPLTKGSSWTYDVLGTTDTVVRSIAGDTTINGLQYARMNEVTNLNLAQYFFNLNNSAYTEFSKTDKYTNSFQYNDNVYGSLPFLNEYLSANQTWESDEFTGTASFGQIIYVKYFYSCANNDATIILNGQGFVHVYVVATNVQIRSQNNAYGPTGERYYAYYAKGIGLIYFQKTVYGALQYVLQIKRWKVN